ncbi:hypothetical protein [Arcobacter sp. FWKO B]|uniref:hypothetical protein n=1 Tax=Arcobacter sp. FWKO B TaxID=2593672 RepID=UPI0018A53E13|nr:hypothetical protein [Arcobacter sp. FWKO B]QOG12543.1 hypothetical protein FWKOB_07425 [Arcobacter sp. FWKO B]
MKRALVDQILLGLFIFVSLIVFGATVADEMETRNKYYQLKKITDNAALTLSKYYIIQHYESRTSTQADQDQVIEEAELISNDMLDQTKLGLEVKNLVSYIWDLESAQKSVIVKIDGYMQNTFWYRFLDLMGFNLNAESKANINIRNQVNDFVPFAINICDRDDFIYGQGLQLLYKPYDIYNSSEQFGFYGLAYTNPDRTDSSQSGFAHFKNEVTSFNSQEQDVYLVDSNLYDSDGDFSKVIYNDAQQLASALEVHKFNDSAASPWNISIALLGCDNDKDSAMNVVNLISVSMDKIYCGDKKTSDADVEAAFLDDTGQIFSNISWVDWVESKDCSGSGLFRMDLTILQRDVQLVY